MYFAPDTDAHAATHDMFRAVDWLRRQARASHRSPETAHPVLTPSLSGSAEPKVVDLADPGRQPRPAPSAGPDTTDIDNETSAAS